MMQLKSERSFFRILLCAVVLFICGCASVADMAGYDSRTLNDSAQKKYTAFIGEARNAGALDTRSNTAQRVTRVFNRMKPHAEAANRTGVPFHWQINVIRSDELNAWAMPGGKMVVYTGLVEKLNLSDDEIAAIIGHEMTHALHEHSKQDAGQKIITGVLMNVAGNAVGRYTGVDPSAIGLAQSLISDFGIDKPYSRHQENEADAGGMLLMAQSGYNPQTAISVWQKMNAVYNNNNALGALVSTHPTNNARIDALQKQLPQVMPIYEASRKNVSAQPVKRKRK